MDVCVCVCSTKQQRQRRAAGLLFSYQLISAKCQHQSSGCGKRHAVISTGIDADLLHTYYVVNKFSLKFCILQKAKLTIFLQLIPSHRYVLTWKAQLLYQFYITTRVSSHILKQDNTIPLPANLVAGD